MRIILSEDNKKISKNRRKLEEALHVKIFVKEKEVIIAGEADTEYLAEKVIEAVLFDFPVEVALLIANEDFIFEVLNIKDYTPRKDLETIRARIIGKEGRTLRTLNQLTDCYFELKGNSIGIIGMPEYIKNSQDAVISLIRGSKQANVYNYLEKHPLEPIIDLGLKEEKKSVSKKKIVAKKVVKKTSAKNSEKKKPTLKKGSSKPKKMSKKSKE